MCSSMKEDRLRPYWIRRLAHPILARNGSSAALHDLSIDEKEAFLEGYGLSPKDVTAAAPAVKAFNIANYFGAIEKACEAYGTGLLKRYRARLSGALDLYSL